MQLQIENVPKTKRALTDQCVINDIPAISLFMVKGQAVIILYFD